MTDRRATVIDGIVLGIGLALGIPLGVMFWTALAAVTVYLVTGNEPSIPWR